MKKIISVIVIVAMLLSASLAILPAGAASNSATVTDQTSLYKAMRWAKGDYTINISGTIALSSALPQCDENANITLKGGTLDLSKLSTVYVYGNISIDVDNLTLLSGGTIYANGYDLAIEEGVSVKYVDGSAQAVADSNVRFTVYGGSNNADIDGDTNLRILSGIYSRIYGGSNKGTITGSTHVTIGSVNNNDLVGWDDSDHGSTYQFYGGSNGGVILGDTNLTVGENAYSDYVVCGNENGGRIGGTAYMNFSGYAYGLYGGSRHGNTMNDVCLTMTGGGVADICGGSADVSLGNAEDPSNVVVKLLGGELTRRLYGGCYNSSYDDPVKDADYVYGNITIIIGGEPEFSFDHKIDTNVLGVKINGSEGIFASSRENNKSPNENTNVIFVGGDFTEQMGQKNGLGFGKNPDKYHKMSYATSNGVITETCSCGCEHSASVTLTLTSSKHEYTGNPIECGVMTYGDTWMSGIVDGVNYQNNVNTGTATAGITLKLDSDYTANKNFTILKASPTYKPNSSVTGQDPDGDGNFDYSYSTEVEVNYTVDNIYTLVIPPVISLGALDAEVPVTVGVKDMVIPIEHILYMFVSSQNGFKVKGGENSIAYTMKYGDVTASEGTEDKQILELRWNTEGNKGDVELGFTRVSDLENDRACELTDTLSFSASIESTGNIPLVEGKEFATADYDQGQGSKLYVAEDIEGIDTFSTYLRDIVEAGYKPYTSNVIGDNHFATFTGFGKIVNVMYTPHYSEIRVVTDLESEFSLPGLESENVYTALAGCDPSLTLVSNYQMGWPGRMGYVFQLSDGSFFIIDGGYTRGKNSKDHLVTSPQITCGGASSAPYLIELLEEFAPDKNNIVIAGWLITHMHEDHFGAFIDISNMSEYKDAKSRMTIEKLIYNQSSMDDIRKTDDYKSSTYTENEALCLLFNYAVDSWGEGIQQKIKAHPGQKFFLRDLTLTVYTSQDFLHASKNFDPWVTGTGSDLTQTKYVNNTSLVTMIEFCGKKALFLADSSAANNPYVVAPLYGSVLDEINIVQVAHHGYADTDARTVYESLGDSLELVIWPSNAQHFYGREIGYIEKGVYYTGTKSVAFNSLLFKDGVKVYVHGSRNLTIKDFVNYTPVEVLDELQIYDKDTWVPDMNYITNKGYK